MGTSLVVQWLRLHAPNPEGLGSVPGQETRPHIPQLKRFCMLPLRRSTAKIKINLKKKKCCCFLKSFIGVQLLIYSVVLVWEKWISYTCIYSFSDSISIQVITEFPTLSCSHCYLAVSYIGASTTAVLANTVSPGLLGPDLSAAWPCLLPPTF